ncbi:hypothetical protein SCHPADRAFT_939285 [Schizopora paradoxa]|uniref:Uncharacterized protein n=1 Tax=Schizopora paradoxa TaxID=27342 RepID=A0A0H2RSB2_9AGAM|nr:hypothetical protein SCHPADRAFT_939285 [Schizopora paradoxa]
MQGYILPVEHGPMIPPPSNPTKVLDKMNGFAGGMSRNKVDKREQDATVRRQILAGMPVTREGGMTRRDQRSVRMASRGRKRRLQDKVEDDARREHRANENVIWLVVINEADDAKIAGKDAMDNSSDSIALDDKQLKETRDKFLEETDDRDYGSDDYASKTQAGGSNLRSDGY